MDYLYKTHMAVRDYECDIQGIVNNANYLHYTEHTRHLMLKDCGLSFADLHNKGIDLVVARMNLQYKTPLRNDDEFLSCLNIEKQGVRYVFKHDIIRARDNKLCFRGQVDIVCLNNGKLGSCSEFDEAFSKYLN